MRCLNSIIDSKDMNLSKLQETVKDRAAWRAAVNGVTKSQIWLSDWIAETTKYGFNCKNNIKEPIRIMWVILASGGADGQDSISDSWSKVRSVCPSGLPHSKDSHKALPCDHPPPTSDFGSEVEGKGEVAREEQAGFLRSHFQKTAYEIIAFPYGKWWDWTLLHTPHKNRSEMVCIPKSTNKSQNQKTFRRNQKRVCLLSSNGQRFPKGM